MASSNTASSNAFDNVTTHSSDFLHSQAGSTDDTTATSQIDTATTNHFSSSKTTNSCSPCTKFAPKGLCKACHTYHEDKDTTQNSDDEDNFAAPLVTAGAAVAVEFFSNPAQAKAYLDEPIEPTAAFVIAGDDLAVFTPQYIQRKSKQLYKALLHLPQAAPTATEDEIAKIDGQCRGYEEAEALLMQDPQAASAVATVMIGIVKDIHTTGIPESQFDKTLTATARVEQVILAVKEYKRCAVDFLKNHQLDLLAYSPKARTGRKGSNHKLNDKRRQQQVLGRDLLNGTVETKDGEHESADDDDEAFLAQQSMFSVQLPPGLAPPGASRKRAIEVSDHEHASTGTAVARNPGKKTRSKRYNKKKKPIANEIP